MEQLDPLQQAPVGAQGSPLQFVPAPNQEPVQAACVVTEQLLPEQHAPVGAQGSLLQSVPAPNQLPAQAACVVTEQVVPVQQPPVGSDVAPRPSTALYKLTRPDPRRPT